MNCEERSGFLFAHACEHLGVWVCANCGRHVCAEHARLIEGQQWCISCVKQQPPRDPEQRDRLRDDPYWYRDTHSSSPVTYDAADHQAFEPPPGGGEAGGGGAEGSFETDAEGT